MYNYEKLKKEIRQIRKKLDDLIADGANTDQIYEISVELDKKFVELMEIEKN
ncbi:MAG TPA: Spo0E family sporulation regulatory protein-aspartic acid phosphatase [Candidatus Aphodoplasma excrementigallinarum]|uniref:Spo0E family sporulation regulatory protein-aspartic acid phosphatase n=1 Tax=Candidatus Aphodoplasma excrementigallinarum TaxID=2840673 RepID=A0A9D1T026_9FIRM|nr:Spo0E family sporulation regulatory protein-aspartic acid phosphatase [Candidatus Aphodoplasma excrementigallinarum]